MSLSGFAWSRHGRHCASRPRAIKPARARTFRCLETAGRLMSKGSASSWTEVSPEASRARIARRVGSARAAKVALRRSGDIRVPVFVFNELVKYTTTQNLSRSQMKVSPHHVLWGRKGQGMNFDTLAPKLRDHGSHLIRRAARPESLGSRLAPGRQQFAGLQAAAKLPRHCDGRVYHGHGRTCYRSDNRKQKWIVRAPQHDGVRTPVQQRTDVACHQRLRSRPVQFPLFDLLHKSGAGLQQNLHALAVLLRQAGEAFARQSLTRG